MTPELEIKYRIRTVRVQEELAQKTVAERLSYWGYPMTHSAYRNMESDKGRGVKINKKLIEGLAWVFNCQVEDLVQDTEVWALLPEVPVRSGRQFKAVTTCPNCEHTW